MPSGTGSFKTADFVSLLQPNPLDILNTRQDDVAAAAYHAGKRVDDLSAFVSAKSMEQRADIVFDF